jgi:hypothetical protein
MLPSALIDLTAPGLEPNPALVTLEPTPPPKPPPVAVKKRQRQQPPAATPAAPAAPPPLLPWPGLGR